MNPNPQEKCMIIRTRGKRHFSLQLRPIIKEATDIAHRYVAHGMKKIGSANTPKTMERREITAFTGGAK